MNWIYQYEYTYAKLNYYKILYINDVTINT